MKGKKISKEAIESIKKLRQQGGSINEISKDLDISKTTVLRYIRNTKILPDYVPFWREKRGGSKKIMELKEQLALEEARKQVSQLTQKEKFLFLAALYWAEGSKRDFGLSNTDPNLIKTYITFLKDVFNVDKDQLRVSIRTYEDLDKDVCLSFWSNIVGIPKEKFINVNVLVGKKKGKLAYGMCRVRVTRGGDLLKKIKAINMAVVETLLI